jgi:hypothetical protein
MKLYGEEINPFEDGQESLLDDLVQKFRIIKQLILDKKLTRNNLTPGPSTMQGEEKEIPLAPHDSNYAKVFKEMYKLELTVEEMIEFRDFAENDYDAVIKYRILTDRQNGMRNINIDNII